MAPLDSYWYALLNEINYFFVTLGSGTRFSSYGLRFNEERFTYAFI